MQRVRYGNGNYKESFWRQFLAKKSELTAQRDVLSQQYSIACENAMKMREMHDKVVNDISTLKSKRDMLKAKVKVAETQQKINKMVGANSALSNMSKFDEMEERINRKLDEADAKAVKEINPDYNIHDFRVVVGPSHTNLVFDVLLPANDKSNIETLRKQISDEVSKINNNYRCVINFDYSYV